MGGLRRRFHRLPRSLRGILWMLASALLFTAMAVAAKLVGPRLDAFQIAFFRAAAGFATVAPFALAAGWAAVRTNRPGLQIARGLTGTTAMLLMFYSVVHLPLAEVTAIGFANPLFLIVLAVLFLGETVRLRRWTATLIGFVGVLIMLRPTGSTDPTMLIALFGTFLVAVSVALIKTMARNDRPMTMLFYFGVFSTVISAVPAALVWQTPTGCELVFLILAGMFGASAQACYIRAFRDAEASLVAPFEYSKLLFAVLFGLVLFDEVPDGWTFAGAAIIVGATLYIARREAALGHAIPPPAALEAPAALAEPDEA